MAKSSVSTGTRTLELYGLARRHSAAGTKRLRYSASDNCSGLLRTQVALMGDIGRLADGRAQQVAGGAELRRLYRIGSFYTEMAQTITARIEVFVDDHAKGRGGRRSFETKAG